ncbi:alpha/beta hydrolase [Shewanella sp. ENK2]|uniref:alpha/beta hydrolase n=1 Tax=Shewanella sp. ENK2 TaxID=2775245 RepID=UPI0037479570
MELALVSQGKSSYIFKYCTLILLAVILSVIAGNSVANSLVNSMAQIDKAQVQSQSLIVVDTLRQREIPIELYLPEKSFACHVEQQCPVMIIGSGYGLLHTDYQFISQLFQQNGYLVVAIQHELATDPALSRTPPFIQTRAENWQRGANTVDFILQQSRQYLPEFDFEHVTLVGHSNGGDISVWLATQGISLSSESDSESESNLKPVSSTGYADYIARIITLDHRRVPLPRNANITQLSIRASDYPADEGVLPLPSEQVTTISVVTIKDAKHNDMNDYGPQWLKDEIVNIISEHMQF